MLLECEIVSWELGEESSYEETEGHTVKNQTNSRDSSVTSAAKRGRFT